MTRWKLGTAIATTAIISAALGADVKTVTRSEAKIEQDTYFAQNGDYTPRNETELSKGINVQTYDGPNGKGYVVIEENDFGVTITDFGKEGRSQIQLYEASSTRRI